MNKWDKFKKDHSYEITDVELLERREPEAEWKFPAEDAQSARTIRDHIAQANSDIAEPVGAVTFTSYHRPPCEAVDLKDVDWHNKKKRKG